ncbi:hypothetical protein UlMin_016844 [Ulmus minor]
MFLPVSNLHFNPQAIYFILGVILVCGGGLLREKGTEELNTYVVAPKTERKGTEEGGFFVPMTTLIIGFNQKSSTAMSKIRYDCGRSNFYYNFNVIFADWMITLLIIAVHFDDVLEKEDERNKDKKVKDCTSTKSSFKGKETWKKETIKKKGEAASHFQLLKIKDIGLLTAVLVALLALQVAKHYTRTCSILYWLLNFLQVSSATSIFVMAFSSSMSIVEYYLLKRLPVPYALYFVAVATISAVVGQYVVGKVIKIIGRASLIMCLLPSMIFISVISLAHVVDKIQHKEYMRFENICKYQF